MSVKVNIVMLVKNRVRLTFQAIKTLYLNTPNELFNLTIVNDESESVFHWDALEKDNLAVLTNEKSKGITGQARNLGVYWAEKYWGRGDYLYLSDNDVYFTSGWLERLIDTFEDPRCQPVLKILGGWNHPFLQPTWKSTEWPDKPPVQVATHDAVAGASQLMKWETWDLYGPLDAHAAGVGQSEDWKMCQDIQMPIHPSLTDKHPGVITKGGGKVGSIYPRVVLNCGVTNSFGQPSPGADVMLHELQESKKTYPDLYWE